MTLNRKTKLGINVFYTVIIILGIIILINYIAGAIFFRVDLTQNKNYSVSKVSKETIKNLDDILNIKGFFSKDVPSNLVSIKQDIKDTIEEYKNYSNGKIRVSYIDPKDDEKTLQEARNLGIPELQFSNLEKDKYQITTGYLGLAIMYGDKKEVIPVLDDTRNLEYELTSAIKKVMQKEDYTVAFLQGHNEAEMENELKIAVQYLKKIYNVTSVDTSDGNLIPDNINTLIIVGAKGELSEREKYVIDQFLMEGKSLMVLEENIDVGEMLQTSKNKSGIDSLLAHYGVKINNDYIVDPSCEMASFSSGYSQFLTSYPFWPKTVKDGLNQDNAISSKLESLVFPWTSSIALNDLQDREAIKLVNSSAQSWTLDNPNSLSPQQEFKPGAQGQKLIAALVSGKFKSYFSDKNKPQKSVVNNDDAAASEKDDAFIKETPYARILVTGDSDFIKDGFLNRFKSNLLFFQNSVDALTMDESLIQIRAKSSNERPIKADLSETAKNSIKFFNIFGITVLVLLAGLLRYFLRRKKKFSDQI